MFATQSQETGYVHVTNELLRNSSSPPLVRQHKATHQLELDVQQGEHFRENCKRVRANGHVSPEESVAALTLNEPDPCKAPARQTQPENNELRFVKLLLSRSKPKEALKALEPIIIAGTSNADALCLRGQCYTAQHENVQVF